MLARSDGIAPEPPAVRSLKLNFKEHNIVMVVPVGAKIDVKKMVLPGGVLILGAIRGRVQCIGGSAIIAKGGEFQGEIEASDVFIEGKVTSPGNSDNKDTISKVTALGTMAPDSGDIVGGTVAFSEKANVLAHFKARAFHIPLKCQLNRSVMESSSN